MYSKVAKKYQKLQQVVEWETKMGNVRSSQNVQKRVDSFRKKYQSELSLRKKKLSLKLFEEDQLYQMELMSLKETPSARRSKLEARAKELQEQRKQRSLAFATEMKERMFQDCDEIRIAKKKFENLTHAEKLQSLLKEKEAIKGEEKEEEKHFDILYKSEMEKQQKREEEEKVRLKELKSSLRESLNSQVEVQEKQKEVAIQEKESEIEFMKNQWKMEEERHKENEQKRRDELLKTRKIIREYNEKKKMLLREEETLEREMDLKIVQNAIDMEKNALEEEKKKKILLKNKQREYRNMLLAQMDKEKIDESELENLRMKEQQEQHQKQIERKNKEEEARQKLMKEVYQTRERQVNQKNSIFQREKIKKVTDRENVDSDVNQYLLFEQEKLRQQRSQNQNHKEFLFKQMEKKKRNEKGQTERQKLEEKKFKENLVNYEKKLLSELERINSLKPQKYQNVKIMPVSYEGLKRKYY